MSLLKVIFNFVFFFSVHATVNFTSSVIVSVYFEAANIIKPGMVQLIHSDIYGNICIFTVEKTSPRLSDCIVCTLLIGIREMQSLFMCIVWLLLDSHTHTQSGQTSDLWALLVMCLENSSFTSNLECETLSMNQLQSGLIVQEGVWLALPADSTSTLYCVTDQFLLFSRCCPLRSATSSLVQIRWHFTADHYHHLCFLYLVQQVKMSIVNSAPFASSQGLFGQKVGARYPYP